MYVIAHGSRFVTRWLLERLTSHIFQSYSRDELNSLAAREVPGACQIDDPSRRRFRAAASDFSEISDNGRNSDYCRARRGRVVNKDRESIAICYVNRRKTEFNRTRHSARRRFRNRCGGGFARPRAIGQQGSVKLDKRAATFITSVCRGCCHASCHARAASKLSREKIGSHLRDYTERYPSEHVQANTDDIPSLFSSAESHSISRYIAISIIFYSIICFSHIRHAYNPFLSLLKCKST